MPAKFKPITSQVKDHTHDYLAWMAAYRKWSIAQLVEDILEEHVAKKRQEVDFLSRVPLGEAEDDGTPVYESRPKFSVEPRRKTEHSPSQE